MIARIVTALAPVVGFLGFVALILAVAACSVWFDGGW